MPLFNKFFGNHIFFENKRQKAIDNANKQKEILKQIAIINQNIREKQRIHAEHIKELQKNNEKVKSYSLKDKIINGVNTLVLGFISRFITSQSNIHLRINDTKTEINNSIKDLEQKTKELLDISDSDNDSDTSINSDEILSEANKILAEPREQLTQVEQESEQLIAESERLIEEVVKEEEEVIKEVVKEEEVVIEEVKEEVKEEVVKEEVKEEVVIEEPIKKKRSFISMLNKKHNNPL